MLEGQLIPLYDARTLAEYRSILARPKFASYFTPPRAAALVAFIETAGEIIAAQPWPLIVPDPKDLPFLEVALAGRADALITGNGRDFPASYGVRVLSPAEALAALAP